MGVTECTMDLSQLASIPGARVAENQTRVFPTGHLACFGQDSETPPTPRGGSRVCTPLLGSQSRALPAPWRPVLGPGQRAEASLPAASAEPEARKTGAEEGERSQDPPQPLWSQETDFSRAGVTSANQHLVPHALKHLTGQRVGRVCSFWLPEPSGRKGSS